jgi:predicted  nucleic acid-binding Zn-ribbon protein
MSVRFSWCRWDEKDSVWHAVESNDAPEVTRLKSELKMTKAKLEATGGAEEFLRNRVDALEAEVLLLKEKVAKAQDSLRNAMERLDLTTP